MLQYKNRIFFSLIVVVLLALVRTFEAELFYDPLLLFFKGEYQTGPLPPVDKIKLFFGLLLRYGINSVLSLAIIQMIFSNRGLTKFTALLYLGFFAILIASFFGLMSIQNPNTLYIFYIRRFLIQPILLLLFVPAFYYQRRNKPDIS